MQGLTPAMRQYFEIKEKAGDAILFFRMGDFYEMFFEDAVAASRVLGIALTSRDRERNIPMCGVPFHSASSYIAKLVKEGYKVAVCEQVENPSTAKGVVKREVTRVITPGVAFEEELLEPKTNNFVAAAAFGDATFGLAYMDASTGDFRVTELKSRGELHDEIGRISPIEVLIPDADERAFVAASLQVKKVTLISGYDFGFDVAYERMLKHFGLGSLEGMGLGELREAVRAAGALLNYIKSTQRSEAFHIKRPAPYYTGQYMVLDSSTRRNLEITENTRDGGRGGTILDILDRTSTAMGGRTLKSWLMGPLKDVSAINRRLDAVEELMEDRGLRAKLKEELSGVFDIERLIARASLGVANPRDLVSLKASLERVPAIRGALEGLSSPLLKEVSASLDGVPEIVGLVGAGINDAPPITVRDGGVIREGYNSALDELRSIGSGGKDWIAGLEAKERGRTGIGSLKVGYNRVFGYYIEVTKANLRSVPADYIRKQTLVNAERFITPDLKEWEERILTAEERSKALEAELFEGIRTEVATFAPRVQATAWAVSVLDVLVSLADVSEERNYSRPAVDEGETLEIEGGRHPVVEAALHGEFVSNDLRLGPGEAGIMILTGPNMAGKSTYLRQCALIVLLAQIGSFVPASRARVPVVDRIFSRIGASDDLSRGQSTFMVEMNETANILNNATSRSLVILDEVGRGTSTFDGLSIAWAVVEYLHDHAVAPPKTLFATHYHELTELSLTKERVKNYNMAVKEWNGRIVFLRKVVPGPANRSYGIQVARLAGLPEAVLGRAREILRNLESGELTSSGVPRIARSPNAPEGDVPRQMSLLGEKDSLREEVLKLDPDGMTPIEALTALYRLKEMIGDGK